MNELRIRYSKYVDLTYLRSVLIADPHMKYLGMSFDNSVIYYDRELGEFIFSNIQYRMTSLPEYNEDGIKFPDIEPDDMTIAIVNDLFKSYVKDNIIGTYQSSDDTWGTYG